MADDFDEGNELIANDAIAEEKRIMQRWNQALYLEAQRLARTGGSRLKGAVYLTKEHFTTAAAKLAPVLSVRVDMPST